MDNENKLTVLELHPELREAFEKIRPYCAEVEYIDSGSFQGGEEECFVKGLSRPRAKENCFVFSPSAIPFHEE